MFDAIDRVTDFTINDMIRLLHLTQGWKRCSPGLVSKSRHPGTQPYYLKLKLVQRNDSRYNSSDYSVVEWMWLIQGHRNNGWSMVSWDLLRVFSACSLMRLTAARHSLRRPSLLQALIPWSEISFNNQSNDQRWFSRAASTWRTTKVPNFSISYYPSYKLRKSFLSINPWI